MRQFLLTSKSGQLLAVNNGSGAGRTFRSYYAQKPAMAAVKAFYAYIRSPEGKATFMSHQNDTKRLHSDTDRHELRSYYDQLTEHMADMALRGLVTPAQREVFMERYMLLNPKIFTFSVELWLRENSSEVFRCYHVGYEPVTNPNRHEIERGINKVAKVKSGLERASVRLQDVYGLLTSS